MSLFSKILIIVMLEIALTIFYTLITPKEKKQNFSITNQF